MIKKLLIVAVLALAASSLFVISKVVNSSDEASTNPLPIQKEVVEPTATPQPNRASLLFYDGFEEDVPFGDLLSSWKQVNVESATVVSVPVRSGNNAIKITLNYDDEWNNPSSELRLRSPEAVHHFEYGSTYWYGFSIYLPLDYEVDSDGDTLNQFLSVQNADEPYRAANPVISFRSKGENWGIWVRGDSREDWKKPDYEVTESFDLGLWQEDVGEWVDWVYHIKWAYNDDGFLQVWKNGEMVVDYQGATTLIGFDQNVRWKIGIYKPSWRSGVSDVNGRVIYYDEIRLDNNVTSYGDFIEAR